MTEQSLPTTTSEVPERGRQPRWSLPLVVYVIGAVAFWAIRLAYWLTTEEELYSDMTAYETTAHGFARDLSLSGDPGGFWNTYWPPGTGVLRGIVVLACGKDSLMEWRLFLATLTFVSLLWLARELAKSCRSAWPSALLVVTVALSRPSVFWSLKVSTEGPTEMFFYALGAATLWFARTRQLKAAFVLGLMLPAAFLTRGSFAPIVPLVLVLVGLRRQHRGWQLPWGWRLDWRACAVLGLGLLVLWSPWLIRNYRIYDAVVPLTTQAPFTFFTDMGHFEATTAKGERLKLTLMDLLARGRSQTNDLEAMRDAKVIVSSWLSENRSFYYRKIRDRARFSLNGKLIYLTRVPRDKLFGGGPVEYLFLDKSPALLIGGVLGFLIAAWVWSRRVALLLAWMATYWLTTILFLGVPRMIEPLLPLLLWGNTGWIAGIVLLMRRRRPAPS